MKAPDHGTIEDVYRAQAPRLWRSLVLHTGDREAAADAVAEAFAQALRRGDAIHDPVRWVWKTAFLLAGRATSQSRQEEELRSVVVPEAPVELLDVLSALRRLSPHQRASVVLHHYAGYSLREVAQIIGSTRAAVGVHLFRGRQRLRTELGVEDG